MPHTTGHGSYRRLGAGAAAGRGAGAYEVRWRDGGRQFRSLKEHTRSIP
jgi:hypothetical protein